MLPCPLADIVPPALYPLAMLAYPLAVVLDPIAVLLVPLAFVLPPIAVLAIPLAVVLDPSAVLWFPNAVVLFPSAVLCAPFAAFASQLKNLLPFIVPPAFMSSVTFMSAVAQMLFGAMAVPFTSAVIPVSLLQLPKIKPLKPMSFEFVSPFTLRSLIMFRSCATFTSRPSATLFVLLFIVWYPIAVA